MKKFGFLDKAVEYLKEAGMEVELFEGIEPDPSVETVMKGAEAMQKFQPEEGNVFECLSERRNIIVMTDEAHRTQYGFKSRNVAVKQGGEVVGTRMVYGLAKYLRDALPNAAYMGFTGTPIESEDVNTPAVFGNYIDIYDIAQAVADGAADGRND